MKKSIEYMKMIQLLVTVAIAIACLVVIFTNGELYQAIGHNSAVRILCIFLWLALVVSFVSIYLDYRQISTVKRHYRELDYNVSNDHIAGIANRFSCDAIIEKYADKALPPTIGCIMLEISNISGINQRYGHAVGNATIESFADALSASSVDLCFVGRNGGNKFMALFEDCNETKLNVFLNRVRQRVETHNLQGGVPAIEYRSGRAFNEGAKVTSITQLIALADRRISGKTDVVTGIPNRNSCDEVIALYQEKPLPADLACVMIDFVNLKAINDERGRLEGNQVLRQFSDILREAARDLCFVGRNGGTTFLAIFDSCTDEKLNRFIEQTRKLVAEHNDDPENAVIRYTWGQVWQEEDVRDISAMLTRVNDRRFDHTEE